MHRVFGQVRISNVALHTLDREFAAHGAAAAVFNHVTQLVDGGGLTDDAVIQHFAACL